MMAELESKRVREGRTHRKDIRTFLLDQNNRNRLRASDSSVGTKKELRANEYQIGPAARYPGDY